MDNNALLQLCSLSFRYGVAADNGWVIKDFDFPVQLGDHIALYGPNGCGKSTLLYLLAGLLTPTAGARLADADLRTGFVFQDYSRSLLNWYTVGENLDLAISSTRERHAHEDAIKEMFDGPLPQWIAQLLPKYPYELSGGQRQLTALLRALLDHPGVLFLDEPFASLDVSHRRLAFELLQRARSNGTVWIVIAHELDDCFLAAERMLIMKGPPLSIARIVDVPLEWPRSFRALGSSAVQEARKQIYEVLWDANNKVT